MIVVKTKDGFSYRTASIKVHVGQGISFFDTDKKMIIEVIKENILSVLSDSTPEIKANKIYKTKYKKKK